MIEPPGSQFWADARWRDGWRLQRHLDGQACRLLNPAGRIVCRGSWAKCTGALEEARPQAAPIDRLVVLLHGLGRTRRSLARLDRALQEAGFTTARLDYPSTRRSIQDHAATLAELLDHIPTPKRLSFVSHSLGGLIVRQLLRYDAPWRAAVDRIVMIAPPNRGASLAGSLDKGGVMRGILGPSYGQIAEGFAVTLPVPEVPVAIFAGDAAGVPGDGLVTVDETRLEGASEHHVVPAIHTFVMNHPSVVRGAVSFLGGAPDRA
ncbi:MAG: alpha/beta hydrolase [Deltaproteobacteria bacterium]|nr:alpha/beta hydrolase [Deltaproteobacteria bacterium]